MEGRELQALLAWSSLPFVGEAMLLSLLKRAAEGKQSLSALWEAPEEELTTFLRLHPKALAELRENGPERWQQAALDAAEIAGRGVDVLVPTEPDCPPALRPPAVGKARPVTFGYGALGLLEEPLVALASSKTVSNAGLAVTEALADALARRDAPLVSSTNREAYQAAAIAAKRHAGPSVLVLDRGLAEAFPAGVSREPVAPARVWDAAFDPELQLLLSPFAWRERWNARSGPRRDALVLDLAEVIVAVDVRPDGTIFRESAARGGRKRIFAVDRGDETADGTRALWETNVRVTRLPWSGAESAAEAIVAALPGRLQEAAEERALRGWQREVAQFLARACAALDPMPGGQRTVGAFPATGPLAQAAAAWSGRGDSTSGYTWLLADFTGEGGATSRPAQLLERVARNGFLAAVVPAAWLSEEAHAEQRGAWLARAGLRLAARLPKMSGGRAGDSAAAIVLEKGAAAAAPAPTFAPREERMGRFHLRRYLQEVLGSLREH